MKAVRNDKKFVQYRMAMPMRSRITQTFVLALFTLVVTVSLSMGQENKQTTSAGKSALLRTTAHPTIYVIDFDLDSANFKQDKGGITGKGYLVPAPPKSFLRRKQEDPAKAEDNLVELMSVSLVRDFEKAGFPAVRLMPTDPRPGDGLLVTGVFTELSEGNQMRRALIGFGSGKAKIELNVMVSRVNSAEQKLYASSRKSNGRGPGALIAMDPYAEAAGFVLKFGMTKNAPEKMIKQTASKIVTELEKQLNSAPLIASQEEQTHSGLQMAARDSN